MSQYNNRKSRWIIVSYFDQMPLSESDDPRDDSDDGHILFISRNPTVYKTYESARKMLRKQYQRNERMKSLKGMGRNWVGICRSRQFGAGIIRVDF